MARLMRTAGLRSKAVQGYQAKVKVHQLYARHPNRLWTATATQPNQVWVGDITYLKVGSTWWYLAIVGEMQHITRARDAPLARDRAEVEQMVVVEPRH